MGTGDEHEQSKIACTYENTRKPVTLYSNKNFN